MPVLLNQANAGGSSVRSEAYAMAVLKRMHGARGVIPEMAITYFHPGWKKCDFVTWIDGEKVGVSVTRALVGARRADPDALDRDLMALLRKKLHGLIVSRAGISENHAFTRSILFVWTPDLITSRLFTAAFARLTAIEPELTDDIELVIVESTEMLLRCDFRSK